MAGTLNHLTETLVGKLEHASVLDGPANAVAALGAKVFRPGPVKDTLSGTASGHPAHPPLVVLPLGSWAAAIYLDLRGGVGDQRAATRLVGMGNLAALPAALTGASDWLDTMGAERRVGLVHAGLNYTALGLFWSSWVSRRRGNHHAGMVTGMLGMATVTVSGWLGGHLAHARGVGTDTTAFLVAPTDWVDAGAQSEVGDRPKVVDAAGVPVLLVRDSGGIRALEDRCTHRGGPLHEGTVEDGCVTCPWHQSRFRLSDGAVVRGPATRPQRPYEVRVLDGRVQVRRSDEPGSLRKNPVTAAAASK